MKIFLDDERTAPAGWLQARWPDEVIALLKNGSVTELSLDHDLGDDVRGTGSDVLEWIEEAVAIRGFTPPIIHIHTANPAARARMELAVDSIRRLKEKTRIRKKLGGHRVYRQFVNGVRNMRDTLYWLDAAIARHQKEIQSQPILMSVFEKKLGMDILGRLEEIRKVSEQFRRDIRSLQGDLASNWRFLFEDTRYDDLSDQEVGALQRMDAQLNQIEVVASEVASGIDAQLLPQIADPDNRMYDRNLDIELTFHLKPSDPGADDIRNEASFSLDDTLAQIEFSWPIRAQKRNPPYASDPRLPLPHGPFLHELQAYGSPGRKPVDFRDILRAGLVWVDIKVAYQYCFDLETGKWVKGFENKENAYQPIYVRSEQPRPSGHDLS